MVSEGRGKGCLIRFARGAAPDPPTLTRFPRNRKAAKQNYPESLAKLSAAYRTGSGVRQDVAEALRYAKLSANAGCAEGCYYLGQMYDAGDGVPKVSA